MNYLISTQRKAIREALRKASEQLYRIALEVEDLANGYSELGYGIDLSRQVSSIRCAAEYVEDKANTYE